MYTKAKKNGAEFIAVVLILSESGPTVSNCVTNVEENVYTQLSIHFFISCVWPVVLPFVTCTCFPIIIQSVSRQTEAVEGARGALTDVLTTVVWLQTQIHTYSREDIDFSAHKTYRLHYKKLLSVSKKKRYLLNQLLTISDGVLHEHTVFCQSSKSFGDFT